MRYTNEQAFKLFHAEYVTELNQLNKAGKAMCRQFFAYAKHREYIDSYSETLNKFLGSINRNAISNTNTEQDDADIAGEIISDNNSDNANDVRKERALKKMADDIMSSVENNQNLDPEILKDLVELLKKFGMLKEEEEQVEAPRRYLPEHCSECRYRLCVETAVKSGEVFDECRYCRYMKNSTEHYDDDKKLDITPAEVERLGLQHYIVRDDGLGLEDAEDKPENAEDSTSQDE
jgi:hypothetical protein